MDQSISEDRKSTDTIKCCGNCAYWMKTSQYEGVCVAYKRLSGALDTTEIRYVCEAWEK